MCAYMSVYAAALWISICANVIVSCLPGWRLKEKYSANRRNLDITQSARKTRNTDVNLFHLISHTRCSLVFPFVI